MKRNIDFKQIQNLVSSLKKSAADHNKLKENVFTASDTPALKELFGITAEGYTGTALVIEKLLEHIEAVEEENLELKGEKIEEVLH